MLFIIGSAFIVAVVLTVILWFAIVMIKLVMFVADTLITSAIKHIIKGKSMTINSPTLIDNMPDWDQGLFNGFGGYVGEDETTRVLCDYLYKGLEPRDGVEYRVFSHEFCGKA